MFKALLKVDRKIFNMKVKEKIKNKLIWLGRRKNEGH